MGLALYAEVEAAYAGECWKCGVPVWVPKNRYVRLKEDLSENFYCCNGHSAVFKKSRVKELEEQLEAEKNRRAAAEADVKTARHAEAVARGKLRAQSERVKNGVCPCCRRNFTNLRRHMATKHPEFAQEST
jgi:ssDNA-binding Zn-finger/Zn-ribbon topoisomerase 1